MDVRQQRAVRIATDNFNKAKAELDKANNLDKAADVQESVNVVMHSLWYYRAVRGCIQLCLILAIVPLFLIMGMLSPFSGPGWYVVMTEFAYWPHFIGWTLIWGTIAAFFNGVK